MHSNESYLQPVNSMKNHDTHVESSYFLFFFHLHFPRVRGKEYTPHLKFLQIII